MATWKGNLATPLVSILCHSYNHLNYIDDAIRGFLIQETGFPFEIILHDDASTDGTEKIIKQYQKAYPTLIKAVIQTENQYSKGRKPSLLSFSHASGQYMAFCEADDFWIDSHKLQRQIDAFMQWSECRLCCHGAYRLFPDGKIKAYNSINSANIWYINDFIENGGGAVPTASLMMHRSVFEILPLWFEDAPVGDYFLQVLGAHAGGDKAIYIHEPMSVYRVSATGSWSNTLKPGYDEHFNKMLVYIEKLNSHLSHRYRHSFSVFQSKTLYTHSRYLLQNSRFNEAFKHAVKSILKSRSILLKKLIVLISALFHFRLNVS
ncbi:MAG: glycosyltransferase [Candidatus Thiodiazotropha sp.]